MYRVEMHVHGPICQGQLIEKIRPITFIVWVLGRVKKKTPKQGSQNKGHKNLKQYFFALTNMKV